MDVTSRIADLVGPAAQSAGLELDGVEVKRSGKSLRVLVTIDLPEDQIGSASLDAVADASRAIGAALDEADVPSEPYTLEVSTPGIDRPLTERRHFSRARTRLVTVGLTDGSQVQGRVKDVEGDVIALEVGSDLQRIPLADVKSGRIEVEWKKLDALGDEDEE